MAYMDPMGYFNHRLVLCICFHLVSWHSAFIVAVCGSDFFVDEQGSIHAHCVANSSLETQKSDG